MDAKPQQIATSEGDAASRRTVDTREHVKERRLARAVWANYSEELAWLHSEGDVCKCHNTRETYRDIVDGEQRRLARGGVSHHSFHLLSGRCWRSRAKLACPSPSCRPR